MLKMKSKLTLQILHAYAAVGVQIYDTVYQLSKPLSCDEIKRFMAVKGFAESEKLLLHPLSALTTEIEHNGERFVPIEWFEIGDDENTSPEYDCGNIKIINRLKGIARTNQIQPEYYPFGIIQKLLEWHFDLFSLLESGDALPLTDHAK